jgi:hypothetical protein
MILPVQSPALDTSKENPFPLSSGIDAKACHSRKGLSVIRGAEHIGTLV